MLTGQLTDLFFLGSPKKGDFPGKAATAIPPNGEEGRASNGGAFPEPLDPDPKPLLGDPAFNLGVLHRSGIALTL
jgi:hypothetical protein